MYVSQPQYRDGHGRTIDIGPVRAQLGGTRHRLRVSVSCLQPRICLDSDNRYVWSGLWLDARFEVALRCVPGVFHTSVFAYLSDFSVWQRAPFHHIDDET